MFVEIKEDKIMAYDFMENEDEPDYETAGILTELDEGLADRVESVLMIKSVEDYKIKILKKSV